MARPSTAGHISPAIPQPASNACAFSRRAVARTRCRTKACVLTVSGAGGPARDGLDLEEILDAPFAALAPVARLFHPAKGRARAARLTVHLDHAGAQRTGEPVGACRVGGL